MAEYASCDPELPLGSTVFPVRLNRLHPLPPYPGSYFVDAAANASGWTAVARRGVTLRNFTAYDGHHPIDYRARLRPVDTLGCAECGEPIVLANFERAGSRVDAVYLWGRMGSWRGGGSGRCSSGNSASAATRWFVGASRLDSGACTAGAADPVEQTQRGSIRRAVCSARRSAMYWAPSGDG